ncbi:MAG: hypothetical protein OXI56_09305 [bacterium]|nr:hypothetical protein [bacterium]MDE0601971.1 hypothetical protein [bacterium]
MKSDVVRLTPAELRARARNAEPGSPEWILYSAAAFDAVEVMELAEATFDRVDWDTVPTRCMVKRKKTSARTFFLKSWMRY